MLDQALLKSGLERLRDGLETNILERSQDEPSIAQDLRHRYAAAKAAKRTGLAFELWRENEITQAAVAWLLGCVFVRFLEDNQLIEQPWISGPPGLGRNRLAEAKEHNLETYRAGLHQTDRDYLLLCFKEMAKLPGVAALFHPEHNPLYLLSPTGHGARALIDFFQRTAEDGKVLLLDFTGTVNDTRFLGDLYQNISESARKRYALVQTPDFVVDFILDRTMTPALEEFGLPGFRIIDPACGSGHFLLAAFERLFARWQRYAPDLDPVEHVNRALGSIYGVDLNPFAVAIARFRLLIAALRACDVKQLRDNFDFKTNLAVGDSLLHGTRPGTSGVQRHAFDDALNFYYETEDKDKLGEYLKHESYHAVVGNPPYITVKDPLLRDAYRDRYRSCYRSFQLTIPFFERFFELASRGNRSGFVGMITAFAFTKQQFGKKLVEEFVPDWELTHVIDTSRAHIPHHGIPTVIVLGRNRKPANSTVRVVGGIRAEARRPQDPSTGAVWRAIAAQVDHCGSQSEWVGVANTEREVLHRHPWSIGGGGAAELKLKLDKRALKMLRDVVSDSGRTTHSGDDDCFYLPRHTATTLQIEALCLPLVSGEDVRDYSVTPSELIIFPYDQRTADPLLQLPDKLAHLLWNVRARLKTRVDFGRTVIERGLNWFEHSMFFPRRYLSSQSIAYANLATHNHFARHLGNFVFNSHAPCLIFDSLETCSSVLGVLSSSTIGFWLRQACHCKGGGGIGGGLATEAWEQFFEYTSAGRL